MSEAEKDGLEAEDQERDRDRTVKIPEADVGPAPAVAPTAASGSSHAPAPRHRVPPFFKPGDIVDERYRVIRLIGHGGMGDVYEVEDQTLGGRVALKTVRIDLSSEDDVEAMERFKREVHLARKVSHPNVCRIFDIGYHIRTPQGDPDGETERIAFLTMEWLHGQTLADLLHQSGPVRPETALPLVSQLAAGLAAAHDAGIVHRDLKSNNVIVMSPAEAGRETRVVITDFGLARSLTLADPTGARLTTSGFVVGTAAYMAPEQVQGRQVTPAADIYALGVVLYEMMTGHLPFEGDSPLSTAVKRLNESPPPPHTHNPEIPPLWEGVILRCLDRDPANRFSSARDVARSLAGETTPPSQRTALRRRKRSLLMSAAAAAAIAVGLISWWILASRPFSPSGPQGGGSSIAGRRTVAILGFKNLSRRPDAEWLSTALSEMLETELSGESAVRAIPGENVARMKVDLAIGVADSLAPDALSRIGRNLGADLLILGSYLVIDGADSRQIRLDIRLQNASTGETVAAFPAVGMERNLFELVAKAGAGLREKLGTGPRGAANIEEARAALPSDPEAARYYSEGLAHLRQFDARAARDLLQKSVALDPGSPHAHAALAEAWGALGYEIKSAEEARQAFDLSAKLPREERIQIEARYRTAVRDWDRAITLYRSLFSFYPDNLEYGLSLAEAQTAAGRGRDALSTIDSLRRLPKPESEDPRIDLTESWAAGSLSDYARQQAAASSAAEKGEARGARLLVARARLREGVAYRNMGDLKAAATSAEEARQIYIAAGDRGGVAWALNNLGNVLDDQGSRTEAKKVFEEVLAIYRETGDTSGVALALGNIASVLINQGDYEQARKLLDESILLYREIGDRNGAAWELNTVAIVLKSQGDLRAAQRSYEEALAIYRDIGDRSGIATELANMANVIRAQGDLDEARTLLDQSLALYQEIGETSGIGSVTILVGNITVLQGDLPRAKGLYERAVEIARSVQNRSDEATALTGVADVLLAQGDHAGARRRHEEALAIREEIDESVAVADSRMALAEIDIEEDRWTEADGRLQSAIEAYRTRKVVVNEALAQALLSRLRAVAGRTAEASRAMDRATGLLRKSHDLISRLNVGLETGEVTSLSGRHDEARGRVQAILEEATRLGIVPIQLQARLILGRIDLRSGSVNAGRDSLTRLAEDARQRGFLLISRKAASSLTGS